MCIAILKPIEGKISDEALRNSFASNRDGAGYAYVNRGKTVIRKGFFNVDEFIKEYRKSEADFGASSPFLIHFRISTGGGVTADNCHPFLTPHGAFIHNGWFFSATGSKSDTNRLAELLGKELDKDSILAAKTELDFAFGSNKLAFLFKDKSYHIINERGGEWSDGTWYSNGSYRRNVVSHRPGPATPAFNFPGHWLGED